MSRAAERKNSDSRIPYAPVAISDEVVGGEGVNVTSSAIPKSPSADGNASGAANPEEALVTATINGVHGDRLVTIFKDSLGDIYVCAEDLHAWRIRTRRLPTILRNGVRYYLLNAVPGARAAINEPTQELTVTVPASELEATHISYAQVALTDEVVSGKGMYVNYEVSAQIAPHETSLGGVFETVLFTPGGVGTSGFVSRLNSSGAALVRTETSWTIDDPEKMRSLRIGDSISRGGDGGVPVRFAGIQFARNFAVQPGFVTVPLPSLKGSAELPSAADLYVNNVLVRSSPVPPGPFDITNIPIVTGSGDVQLVVRDLLGRQQLVSQSYYSSLSQLRRGLDDYSYEAGFLRHSFGTSSNDYGSFFVSGSHRYGFTDWLTAEAHVEGTGKVQGGGVGASMVMAGMGQLEGTVAVSRSDKGEGLYGAFTFDRRAHGLSLGAHAEFSTRDYTTIGASPGASYPSMLLQAFAGLPFPDGSVGLSYLLRKTRTEPGVQFASANVSLRLGRLGSLTLAGRMSLEGPRDKEANVLLILPFGSRTTGSVGATVDAGVATVNALLQRSLPVGNGLGYRFSASTGRFEQVLGEVTVRTDFGDYDALLTWTDGKTGLRLSTAGSVGIVGGSAFASRHLDQAFADVKVGDYAGVRVYADNQLVGRTGAGGTLIVPNLRAYDRNVIRIDPNDLPLDAQVAGEQQTVRPASRQGPVVKFNAKPSHAVLIRVQRADGSPLPAGSTITVAARGDEIVSAPGGDVYLTGLEHDQVAHAQWADGACDFPVPVSAQAGRVVQCQAASR